MNSKYDLGEYRIVTEQARYPLLNIVSIFESHNLHPIYQRRRVWDNVRRSRLIESFIINVPIPPVFLYEYEFSKYEVMDGLQRISTIIDFLNNDFSLSGLEMWNELNGKKFSELPIVIQDGIKRRYLAATILLKETASDDDKANLMKQFVFERLNTGGVSLSPQEIRNALNPSFLNTQILKLADSKMFEKVWGSFETDEFQRMEDCELILRFFAYKSACKVNISKPTKYILDVYAKRAKAFSNEDVEILIELFNSTIFLISETLGYTAFKSTKDASKNEKMIYDTIMLSYSKIIEQNLSANLIKVSKEKIINGKFNLIEKNKTYFNGKYTSIKNVNQRTQLMFDFLKDIINE